MKKYLLPLLFVAATLAVWADTLSPADALARARGMAPDDAKAELTSLQGSRAAKPAYTLCDSVTAQPLLYAFNKVASPGWVIVAADDRAQPLLGYSDEGRIHPDSLTPAFRYWMDSYADEIRHASPAKRRTSPVFPEGGDRPYRAPIAPLVPRHWDQGAPYNDLCPTFTVSSKTQKAYSGCVATAMAQIMATHNFPAKGKGSKSYTSYTRKKSLSMNFANVTLDWPNMLDVYTEGSYTTAQGDAVAQLMQACGYSVEMDYASDSSFQSGAVTGDVADALVNYWGYDPSCIFVERRMYCLREWEDLLYDQLRRGLPMQFSGRNSSGGHSFVCDGLGRSNSYFHINWGWGGQADGYFLLSVLDPQSQGIGGSSAGYSQSGGAVINIFPTPEGQQPGKRPVGLQCLYNAYVTNVSTTNKTFKFNGAITTLSSEPFSGYYGYGAIAEDGTFYELANNKLTSLSQNRYAAFNSTVNCSSLPDGVYKVYPIYQNEGETVTRTMRMPAQNLGYILVKKGAPYTTKTFEATAPMTFTPRMIEDEMSDLYMGRVFEMKFKITSDCDSVQFIALTPTIFDTNGNALIRFGTITGDIFPGENTFTMEARMPTEDTDFPAGQYIFALVESRGQVVKYNTSSQGYNIYNDSAPIAYSKYITINADPGAFGEDIQGNFSIEDADNVDWYGIRLNYSVFNNTSGLFDRYLMMGIYTVNDDTPATEPSATLDMATASFVDQVNTPWMTVSPNATKTGQYKLIWENGQGLTRYLARIAYVDAANENIVFFPQNLFFTTKGVTGIDDASLEASPVVSSQYYDLQGRLLQAAPSAGLYICRDTHLDGTVTTRKMTR